jgi:hypothetical protein
MSWLLHRNGQARLPPLGADGSRDRLFSQGGQIRWLFKALESFRRAVVYILLFFCTCRSRSNCAWHGRIYREHYLLRMPIARYG